jgi:hypothetical protein
MESQPCRNNRLICCYSCEDWDGLRYFDHAGYLLCMPGLVGLCRSDQRASPAVGLEERATASTFKCGYWRPSRDIASGCLPGCRYL